MSKTVFQGAVCHFEMSSINLNNKCIYCHYDIITILCWDTSKMKLHVKMSRIYCATKVHLILTVID